MICHHLHTLVKLAYAGLFKSVHATIKINYETKVICTQIVTHYSTI